MGDPMRRMALVSIGLMIAFAGCGSDDESETTGSAAESSPTSTASNSENASALEGTWETDPITVADMEDTLREARLGEHVGKFEQNAPISGAPTSLILEVRDDWDLSGQTEGKKATKIDYDAEYEVEGDEVVVTHSEGSNTFRWSVNGDVLKLTWIETTLGSFKGIPEEAFQRALYMTAEFHRTP
jgi:hypothetical protein